LGWSDRRGTSHSVVNHGPESKNPGYAVAKKALKGVNYHIQLQDDILNGMKTRKEQMIDKKVGDVYGASFGLNGVLKLKLLPATATSVLFPPANVVEELLQSK
jgi:hypothetical protein